MLLFIFVNSYKIWTYKRSQYNKIFLHIYRKNIIIIKEDKFKKTLIEK